MINVLIAYTKSINNPKKNPITLKTESYDIH